MTTAQKISNFYKRWDVPCDEEKRFEDFKTRAIGTIDSFAAETLLSAPALEQRYLKIVAKQVPQAQYSIGSVLALAKATALIGTPSRFKDSVIFKVLSEENDFKSFILYLQAFFWLRLKPEIEERLYQGFMEDIRLSLLDVELKRSANSGVVFYPKGARFLDEGIINNSIEWLDAYPKAQQHFIAALEKYQNQHYPRNLIDDLRSCLEELLKAVLHNRKRLEEQGAPLGQFLQKKGMPKEIRNMHTTLLSYYCNYQNQHAKHGSRRVLSWEIEFLIYLTGTFVRFIASAAEAGTRESVTTI